MTWLTGLSWTTGDESATLTSFFPSHTQARSAEGSEDNGFSVTFHILRHPACAGQTGEKTTTTLFLLDTYHPPLDCHLTLRYDFGLIVCIVAKPFPY